VIGRDETQKQIHS